MPYALHDEASWAAWSFAPFVRQAVTLRARAGLAAAVRDSLVDEGFAARARAADGGDVELQREARDAQAVPAGEGFDDDDGDCLRGKVYADLCSERKLEKGSGGVGAQPPRNL